MKWFGTLIPLTISILGAQNLPTSHVEVHRQEFAKFQQQLTENPGKALTFARGAVAAASRLGRDDPRRGDALEMLCLALMDTGATGKMLEPATELVRIRKATRPPEHELEGLAFSTYAVALFAADRPEDSDRALRDSLSAYRLAFGAHDIQLAQKLESQAELVQSNFGRKGWAIDLLKEAMEIRSAHPESSPGKLAETIQQLTMYQLERGEVSEAEGNLKRAQALLEKEMQHDPAREETKAGLGQILVLRSGVAGKLGQRAEAMSLAEQARALSFRDRVLGAEKELEVASSLSVTFENLGDLPRSVAEENKAVDVFRRNQDLLEKGDLEVNLLGDLYIDLAQLHTQLRDLDDARRDVGLARDILGNSAEVLFAESEVARQEGDAALGVRRYQEALRVRKESTTEVTVFFGTNRKPEPAPREQLRFGGEVAAQLTLGRAAVLVPGAQFGDSWHHRRGGAVLPVGSSTEAEKLFIRQQQKLDEGALTAAARAVMARARLYPHSALVFVHGYNVSFEAAVQRAAQLVRDLDYDGPLFVFSWPSQDKTLWYGTDRAIADESVASLALFLKDVQQITGDAKLNIVAHSMGNRVLLPALSSPSLSAVRPKLGEIILAAPAVPQGQCALWLDRLNQQGLNRFTLYASRIDLAMWAALAFTEGTILAGHAPTGQPFVHAGVDSIDISEAGLVLDMNHDVFASNPVMVEDMRQLLQKGIRPPDRRLAMVQPKGRYWYYREPLAGGVAGK